MERACLLSSSKHCPQVPTKSPVDRSQMSLGLTFTPCSHISRDFNEILPRIKYGDEVFTVFAEQVTGSVILISVVHGIRIHSKIIGIYGGQQSEPGLLKILVLRYLQIPCLGDIWEHRLVT